MKASELLRLFGFVLNLTAVSVFAGGSGAAASRDLWIHPRNETYDPAIHYRDSADELYYKAENGINNALGSIAVNQTRITVELGPELLKVVDDTNGSLEPVILYDSDHDLVMDRTIRGRVDGTTVIFDGPQLSRFEPLHDQWQLGIRYVAGESGDASFDGRYLASVDSETARIAWREGELPAVAAAPTALLILKHREGTPFDFPDFVENPTRYMEDFDSLTPQADADDWTVGVGDEPGRLVTHLGRENLFLVRAQRGHGLGVEWGDVPFGDFFEKYLEAPADSEGCYKSLDTKLQNYDGTRTVVPHRLMYCPNDSVALFDAPPGYQVGLSALRASEVVERTDAGTSISDNVKLYVEEIYPRNPSRRATGTLSGNIRGGLSDAGLDLKDALRHLVTGTEQTNVHTGQRERRPSLITGLVTGVVALVRLRPGEALDRIFAGAESGAQAGADTVSAVDNAVVNPTLQLTVGLAASPDAADTAGDWFGATTQALAKNLPGGERFNSAVNPASLWGHNRAFAETRFTRTDTQLNIDRIFTIIDVVALSAIRNHNDNSGDGGGDGGDGGGGGGGGGGSCVGLVSRGAPNGRVPTVSKARPKFCFHPSLAPPFFGLPVKF